MLKFEVPVEKYGEYLHLIITDGSIEDKHGKFIFKCPFCTPKAKDKHAKKAYLLTSATGATIGCFRCSIEGEGDMYFPKFMKIHYPDIHIMWQRDIAMNNKPIYKKTLIVNKVEEDYVININYSDFMPITHNIDSPLLKNAINYVTSRKFPKHIWEKFFVCENGRYANRLIIPFYNRDGSYTYFNSRDLTGKSQIKYLKPEHLPEIPYNANFVDYTKPFFIYEGEADSFFAENSCSVGGVTKIEGFLAKLEPSLRKNAIVMTDGDKIGLILAYQLLRQGISIFNWSKEMFALQKDSKIDLNELVVKNFFNTEDFTEKGQIKTEVLMKYVLQSNIANMILYKMEKDILGIEVEEVQPFNKKEYYAKTFQTKR